MGWLLRIVFVCVALFAALAAGVAWYAVAGAQSGNVNLSGNLNANARPDASPAPAAPPSVSWGEERPQLHGMVAVPRLTLRRGTDAASPVAAELDTTEYDQFEIVRADGNRLLVRFGLADEGGAVVGAHEGWVEWGQVVPHAFALVVDADDGGVRARVPLLPGVTRASFSRDGGRVLFYGATDHHDPEASRAYEYKTDGYDLVRSLRVERGRTAALLYGPGDGGVSALVHVEAETTQGRAPRLHAFAGSGDKFAQRDGGPLAGDVMVSPDGSTGLLFSAGAAGTARVEVLDMATLEVRRRFRLKGATGEGWPYERALSADGSELYYRSTEDEAPIVVVDTRTGRRVRQIPFKVPENQWASFSQDSLAGDALLVRFWRSTETAGQAEGEAAAEDHGGHADGEETVSESFWLKPDGTLVAAEEGVHRLFGAGERLYAIDDAGTRLFRLDEGGRVVARYEIARPEARHEPGMAETFEVMGLAASPDGKRIVIFYGIPDRC